MQQRTFRPPEPRATPYVWVTWLTKLLAGESKCEWALWFKSRHRYDKLESGFDLERWTREHEDLVEWRVAKLRELGHNVLVEDENGFRVEGKTATVAGKPDVAILTDTQVTFEDCKTGRRRDSDHMQILLYAILAGTFLKQTIQGALIYTDGIEVADMGRVPEVRESFKAIMATLNSQTPPPKTPSFNECRYCDIAKAYCGDRIQDTSNAIYRTEEF